MAKSEDYTVSHSIFSLGKYFSDICGLYLASFSILRLGNYLGDIYRLYLATLSIYMLTKYISAIWKLLLISLSSYGHFIKRTLGELYNVCETSYGNSHG